MGKVNVTSVSMKRVFNLGNYQTLAIELIAAVNEGDNVQKILSSLEEQADTYMQSREQ